MNRRNRAQRRLEESRIPLRPSPLPAENAPVWASTSTTGLVALIAALQAQGLPIVAIVVIVALAMVLGFVGGLLAQRKTRPNGARLEHD